MLTNMNDSLQMKRSQLDEALLISPLEAAANSVGTDSLSPGTFLQMYCVQHRCSPVQAKRKIFWHCLSHPLTRPLAWLLFHLQPKIFQLDLGLISHIGGETDLHQLNHTVVDCDGFDPLHPDNNVFRKSLGLRVSRRKLIALAHETFGAARRN
jgi:hypothetical protein